MLRLPDPDLGMLAELRPYFDHWASAARESLAPLRAELISGIRRSDPIRLYGQLQVLDALRRNEHRGDAIFGSDAAVEFFGGLIAALPREELVALTAPRNQPWEDYGLVREMDEVLRRFASADITEMMAAAAEGPDRTEVGFVRGQFLLERGFNRMEGYEPHLRALLADLLLPLAEASRAVLGFSLADVVRLADAHVTRVERHLDDLLRTRGMQQLGDFVSAAAFPATAELPALLATDTGLSEAEVSAALEQLGTRIGGQRELLRMTSDNSLRRRPVMITPDGRYLWPRPADFLHSVLDWLDIVCAPHDELLKLVNRSRERLCEVMSYDVLARIFGADRVWANPTYPANGQQPDIDVLVTVPGAAIVVEAKSGRLTEAGRRGAPDRVRKKIAEFIEKAQAQNARTVAHLTGAQPRLRVKKKPLELTTIPVVVPIVVTLERLDPLAANLPGTQGEDQHTERPVSWMVGLADLLMVADVLPSPEEFFAYAEMRARLAASPGISACTEADVLGLWCAKRIDLSASSSPARMFPSFPTIGHQSDDLNRYYTAVTIAAGAARAFPEEPPLPIPPRPASALPAAVLAALQAISKKNDPEWASVTAAALAVTPDQWTSVRRSLKCVSTPGDSRKARRRARQAGNGIIMPTGLVVGIALDETRQPVVSLRLAPEPARAHG
ncbi:hypothetical protein ACFWN2_25835 [Lentzea sp. NPDC058436]|uniref:hypothetical protein n=1 Tax=Lentzea sp. NPDC058436 TaxID=3346499 RepID=UPI00364688AB